MQTRTFDPTLTWQRMLEDVEFSQQTPEGAPREVWQEIVRQLAEVIGDQMEAPLSVASFMETKLRVARHFVATSFPERLIRAYPDDHPIFMMMGRETIIEVTGGLYAQLVEMAEMILGDVPAFLSEQGVSEEIFLGHPKGAKLEGEAMRAWRAGTLTVGGLLMMQPKAILSFTD